MILDAIVKAIELEGAEVQVISPEKLGLRKREKPTYNAEDGWREVEAVLPGKVAGSNPEYPIVKEFIKQNPQIKGIYAFGGGRGHSFEHVGPEFRNNWLFANAADTFSRFNNFPDEIWRMMEDKICNILSRTSEVRMTDAQGSDLRFSVPSEETAKRWGREALSWEGPGHVENHVFMYPPMVFRIPPHCPRTLKEHLELSTPVWDKTNGVLAATTGHNGFYPHIILHIEKGIVTEVEGEGKTADGWRRNLEKYRDVQYPGFPRPGYSYLNDIALATNPKACRTEDIFDPGGSPMMERNRSGVIHCGFGCESVIPEFKDFVKREKVPGAHGSHIHIYFPTYECRIRATGEWVKIVDKGRLTLLDDYDVRRQTMLYGNPDDILSEEWIPAVPGINYPGDYMEDYGKNPVPWVKRDLLGEFTK
jgi:hypothetical protein